MSHIAFFFALLAVIFCSCGNENRSSQATLRPLRQSLWTAPDSCLLMLQGIDTTALSADQKMEYYLLREHAWLRAYSQLAPDSMPTRLITYFASRRDKEKEGEAYYLRAAEEDIVQNSSESMKDLKKAEELLSQKNSAEAELLGMMYYRMGKISETDMLYNVANEYYQKALPYLLQTELYTYIASTYRDLGRTVRDAKHGTELRNEYLTKALQIAEEHCDTTFYLNILSYQLRYERPIDTLRLQQINRYLCTDGKYPRAAAELAEYHIEQQQLDSATYYLDIFSRDTATLDWSREKYHYLHSRLMHQKRQYDLAEQELRALYDDRTRQLAADGKARTYAVSQQYDVLRAKQNMLERQIKLQNAYIIIAMLVILLLIGGGIAIIFILRSRHQKQRDLQQILDLKNEVRHKRELLRTTLEQRVKLTKELQNSKVFSRKKSGDIPDWAKEYIDNSLFSSQQQWEDFQREFNLISNDFLKRLKEEYPDLTNTDIQIIALIITGLSISDICILLNQTKNTIWSRRQRIKIHIGLTQDDRLDEWLLNKYEMSV